MIAPFMMIVIRKYSAFFEQFTINSVLELTKREFLTIISLIGGVALNIHIIWLSDHIANSTAAHTHDFYQLIFCKSDGGKITVGETKFTAKKNFVYLIKPSTMHSITRIADMGIIEIKFFVFDSELCKYLNALPSEFQLCDIAFMKMIFAHLSKVGIERRTFCAETVKSALTVFLAEAIREFNEKASSAAQTYQVFFDTPKGAKSSTDIAILDLKNYIEQNLNKKITLDELAQRVSLNKTYFVKRFKILFGAPPMKYIMDMRIERAKTLLSEGILSVSQISEKLGFNSLHYFSAAFKQREGSSPTSYCKYPKR